MRSFVRLAAAILVLPLLTVPLAPVRAMSDSHGWHRSPESLIITMYSSPLQWLWSSLPVEAVRVPGTLAPTRLNLPAPTEAAPSPIFFYDNALGVEQRLSELRRISACLEIFPARLRKPLAKITVKAGAGNPRALSDGRQIIIHSLPLSDEELCNVVAHEMGHVIDLGLLEGDGFEASTFRDGEAVIPADDLSVPFYAVSWQTEEVTKTEATRLDFVTGYARTNPFEEFGEMTELYVRQGAYLRSLLPTSEALRTKYAYLRDVVFEGTEFNTGKSAENMDERKFDSTLIGIKYN